MLTPNEILAIYRQPDWLLGTLDWCDVKGLLWPAGPVLVERGSPDIEPYGIAVHPDLESEYYTCVETDELQSAALEDVAAFLGYRLVGEYLRDLEFYPDEVRQRLEAKRPKREEQPYA